MSVPSSEEETVVDATKEEVKVTEPEDRGNDIEAIEAAEREAAEAAAKAADSAKAEDKADPEDKPEAGIPKARFNEVNARMKAAEAAKQALEEELKALRKPAVAEAKKTDGPVDLDALEDDFLEALRAGDGAKAKQVRSTINSEVRRLGREDAVAVLSQRDIAQALTSVANDAIVKYPFLSTTSDAKDDQAIADVVEWREFFVSKGDRPDVALKKAVDKIGPMYAPKVEPVADDEKKADPRERESLIRNAKAAAAQPAPVHGMVGERSSAARLDVTKMTDEEFEKLPASERKRLRGDL